MEAEEVSRLADDAALTEAGGAHAVDVDAVAQFVMAFSISAISSEVAGCRFTKEVPLSTSRPKNSGESVRHWSQSMQDESTKKRPATLVVRRSVMVAMVDKGGCGVSMPFSPAGCSARLDRSFAYLALTNTGPAAARSGDRPERPRQKMLSFWQRTEPVNR